MKDNTHPDAMVGAGGHIAILGGSAEARDLAARLGPAARVWLPGRDRVTGQEASAADFAAWLREASVLVIAAHPCDAVSAIMARRMADRLGLPFVTVLRPAWQQTRRDHWVPLACASDAAHVIPNGRRVLITLGRPALRELRALRHVVPFVRQLVPHHDPCPLPRGRYLHGTPPFTVAGEVALMRKYRIDAVLTRNAGGPGGWPKIAAARALGVTVYMVDRPRPGSGAHVETVEAALEWLRAGQWLDA